LEDELFHSDGRHAAARRAPGENAAGDVDVRHDPAAEDIAVLVGVGGHRHDAQRRQLVLGEPVHLPFLRFQVAQRPATERSAAGPIGMPKSSIARSSVSGFTPWSSMRNALYMYGPSTRLTRNPGASFTGSGSLSIWRTKAAAFFTSSGFVFSAETISTSCN